MAKKKSDKPVVKSKKPNKARKSVYKKRTKGIKYIAEKLQKYYPKRYSNGQTAKERAKEILTLIKQEGGKVSVANMLLFERKKRVKRDGTPEIVGDLGLDGIVFYSADSQLRDDILLQDKRIRFYAPKIFPDSDKFIVGGESNFDYESTFKTVVDRINMYLQPDKEKGSYEFFFVASEPQPVGKKPKMGEDYKFYKSFIRLVNNRGEVINVTDWQVEEKAVKQNEEDKTKAEQIKELEEELKDDKKDSSGSESELIKEKRLLAETELKIKQQDAEARKELKELYSDGIITKDEYREALKKLI